MLLASSPSRLKDLKVTSFRTAPRRSRGRQVPRRGVTGYIVSYGPAAKPDAQQMRVSKPSAVLSNVVPGTVVAVKAVNAKGLEGWDWARVTVK